MAYELALSIKTYYSMERLHEFHSSVASAKEIKETDKFQKANLTNDENSHSRKLQNEVPCYYYCIKMLLFFFSDMVIIIKNMLG